VWLKSTAAMVEIRHTGLSQSFETGQRLENPPIAASVSGNGFASFLKMKF
jgi:hypothetical protein